MPPLTPWKLIPSNDIGDCDKLEGYCDQSRAVMADTTMGLMLATCAMLMLLLLLFVVRRLHSKIASVKVRYAGEIWLTKD